MNLRFEISDLKKLWLGVRQVFGDAAYESYVRSFQRMQRGSGATRENYLRSRQRRDTSGGQKGPARAGRGSGCKTENARLLSREEFYLDSLRRRYSGVSRCC